MRTYLSIPQKDASRDLSWVKKVVEYSSEEKAVSCFDVVPSQNAPLPYRVSRRVEAILQCNYAVFCEGWKKDPICVLEHEAARGFNISISYE